MKKNVTKAKNSYRHGNLREAILQVSLKIIERDGVENLSIREAAKAVGVTHQAPYRHFKDRNALLAALAQDGFEKLSQHITNFVESVNDPMSRLLKLGEGYLDWAHDHSDHFRLLFNRNIPEFESSTELQSSANQVLLRVLTTVQDLQTGGFIRNEETRALARQYWATVHGATILFIDGQFKPLGSDFKSAQELVRELLINLTHGLAIEAGSGRRPARMTKKT